MTVGSAKQMPMTTQNADFDERAIQIGWLITWLLTNPMPPMFFLIVFAFGWCKFLYVVLIVVVAVDTIVVVVVPVGIGN